MMKTQPVAISPDATRNILRVDFRGIVTGEELERDSLRVQAALAELKRGFAVVVDLTDLERMELDSVALITRVMDLCLAAGVGQVVRVIPDPAKDIGFNILSITHYRGHVPIVTCETRAEAEHALGVRQGEHR